MTDRELLELAAKAAGITFDWCGCGVAINHGHGESGLHNKKWVDIWNPLTDDGDALRLAVGLGIGLEFVKGILIVTSTNRKHEDMRDHGGDLYAATRRAIVRAAAEIGRAMP